jgi:MbtH protein
VDDNGRYRVVVNDEEQFSIWPEGKRHAPGWRDAGFAGNRADCLDHIEQRWTDLRPLSLRRAYDTSENDGRGA